MARFYGHFAAAYGTFWLVLLGAALLSQSHIAAGEFGLFGFPIIAFIYAAIRVSSQPDSQTELRRLRDLVEKYEYELGRQDTFGS